MATKKAAPAKGTKSTAVAKKSAGGAVVTAAAFEEFAGAGMENVTASDILIPRIAILQALSPQINARKPEYIEGAQAGNICDVAIGALLPDPLPVIPVYYMKQWLEWAPRESGKGLQGIHDTDDVLDDCEENDRGQMVLPNGNIISETAQFFVINLMNMQRCFIPMTSTQLKKARKWLTLATSERVARGDGSEYTPPLFYRSYQLGTVPEENNKGDWIGWTIERGDLMQELPNWETLFKEAVAFRDQLLAGRAKADVSSMRDEADQSSDNGAM